MRLPHDAVAFSVQLPSVPVPPHPKTSYVCMWVQPPQDRKYHIYSVRLVSPLAVRDAHSTCAYCKGSYLPSAYTYSCQVMVHPN